MSETNENIEKSGDMSFWIAKMSQVAATSVTHAR